jgi:hypothetical protein
MSFRPAIFVLSSLLTSALLLHGADAVTRNSPSRYRAFQLGGSIAEVGKEAGIASPEAKVISSRPERVEELNWRSDPSSTPDSVQKILFRFYNGALFEMAISYDPGRTGGLTDADLTEALDVIYGPGSAPIAKEMAFNSGYSTTVRAITQWDDPQSRMTLVGFPYGGGFGLVVSSTRDEPLAQRALLESKRLDQLEAPQKELDLRAKQAADTEAKDEKSRVVNKPEFRP